MCHHNIFALSIVLMVGHASVLHAALYTYTKIADSNGRASVFSDGVSINSLGTVVFHTSFAQGGSAIFTGDSTQINMIAGPTQFGGFGAFPTISSDGLVAFVATGGPLGVYTGDGVQTQAVLSATHPYGGFADPSINDSATISVLTQLRTGRLQILRVTGGTVEVVADNAGQFSGIINNLTDLNENGEVAFLATLSQGGGAAGVFTADGTVTRRIADTSGIIGQFVERATINDSGDAAFTAILDDGEHAVFVSIRTAIIGTS